VGLKKLVESDRPGLVFLETAKSNVRSPESLREAPRKWALVCGALVLVLLLLPYGEALLFKPALARKLAALEAQTNRLDVIDRELDFLKFLKQSQPPYLDALYLLSKSAASGTRIDTLTMNRRGEMSLRGSMRNSEQVAEFRGKLIASGMFATVGVDEQTPTPDRQKVNVRITGQWKPLNELQTLALGPTAEEIEKAKSAKGPGGAPGMPMSGGPMTGRPPGVPPPGVMVNSPSPGATPAPPGAVRGGK
jgi:hypothetical protein